MTSFLFATSGNHYSKSHRVFLDKSGQTEKINDLLQLHIPPLVQMKTLQERGLNILSIGSGNGQTDLSFLRVIKEELVKTDLGRNHGGAKPPLKCCI